ncbi:hypothetical protein C9993_11990, partial [Marinobacter sp. Z-F4-2]
ILEYMRAGLPIVTSDNPSVSSILEHEHDSIIYEEGNIDSVVASLLRLVLSSEDRSQLGAFGQSKVENDFSTTAMLARYRNALTVVIR